MEFLDILNSILTDFYTFAPQFKNIYVFVAFACLLFFLTKFLFFLLMRDPSKKSPIVWKFFVVSIGAPFIVVVIALTMNPKEGNDTAVETNTHQNQQKRDSTPEHKNQRIKAGWVYLGNKKGAEWATRNFSWRGDPREPPAIGAKIRAAGDVHLRAGPAYWSERKQKWPLDKIVGLVKSGESVIVQTEKEVDPDVFWARIEMKP